MLMTAGVAAMAQERGEGMRRTTKLPEVTVRLKPIEQAKDTIKYNVAAFQGKDDHYLEDVLKKMPGIEVGQNGVITYKGETINQLNIEGQNLLGNRYSQATQNLPVEAISQVQVMENDQPVRALKASVPSARATLNIKLKSGYKVRPFGEVEAGAGGFGSVLWNNHLSAVNIGKKNQLLLTAKMNNTGESFSGRFMSGNINVADFDSRVPLPQNSLRQFGSYLSPVPSNRYLDNKSSSVSLNHLRRIGQYGSLRTNIDFTGESCRLADSTSFLFGGSHSVALFQARRTRQKEYTVVPKLQYELNAPTVYVSDNLTASLSYQTDEATVNSSGRQLDQGLTRHPSYLQNRFAATISSGLHTYNVASTLLFFRRSEAMAVADATHLYDTAERLLSDRFYTDNSVFTSFPLWGNVMSVRYGIAYRSDGIDVDATGTMRNSYLLNTLAPGYTVRYSRGFLSLECPVNYYAASVPWAGGKADRFYVAPSLKWNHRFTPLWRLTLSGAMQQNCSDEAITPRAYLSDYRTLTATTDRLGWMRSSSASVLVNYSDFVSMFTWQLLVTMSWRNSDWRYSYDIGDDYTTMTPMWEKTDSRFFMAQTRAEKTLAKIHFSVQGSLAYSRTEMPVVQNGQGTEVKSNVVTAGMKLRWYHLSWLQLTSETTFNVAWQDSYANSGSFALKSLYSDLLLTVSPFSWLSVDAVCNSSLHETSRGEYRSLVFADAKVRCMPGKRWELSVSVNNAFNRRQYVDASFSGFNYRYYSMPLRGREMLVSVKYKF